MRNRYLMNASLAFASLLALNACDSREDYFYVKCDEPEVAVMEYDSITELVSSQAKYALVTINWGETRGVKLNFSDQYDEQITDFQVKLHAYGTGGGYLDPSVWDNSLTPSKSYPFNEKFVDFELDKTNNTLLITEKTKSVLDHIGNGYLGHEPFNVGIYAKNKIGKEGYANVLLVFKHNACPKAELIISDGENSMEKVISVNATDPNGDKVTKYEYCIDGSVIFYNEYGGYDNVDENPKFHIVAPKEGEGAYNGTYITATSLSSVKHVFQTTGEHSIYVRCKDERGMWCNWVKETITIRE